MSQLLGSEGALTPNLPLLQRLLVIGVLLPCQMPWPPRSKIAVFYLPGSALIILTQTLCPQRTALAVLLVCQIAPVQPAGAAVEQIQFQMFSVGAQIDTLCFIIGKRIPLQFH